VAPRRRSVARSATSGARAPIRGYDNWTIAEMQKRLARRSPEELQALLVYERASRRRKGAIEALARVIALQGGRSAGKPKARRTRAGRPASPATARRSVAPPPEPRATRTMTAEVVAEAVSLAEGRELDRAALLDKLSEYLEHERNGVKLYELGLEKIDDEEQRDRLEEFLEQTRLHAEVLAGMLRSLGGNPDERSPSAELDHERNAAVREVEADGEVGRIDYFQNLAIQEFVCHASWELLMRCTHAIQDEEVKRVLEEKTASIEDEEDEHYRWALKQATDLTVARLFRAPQEAEASAESVDEVEIEETAEERADEAHEAEDAAAEESEDDEDEEHDAA
jgi:rubrerythrin